MLSEVRGREGCRWAAQGRWSGLEGCRAGEAASLGGRGSHVWLAGATSGGGRGWRGRVGANHRASSCSPSGVVLRLRAMGSDAVVLKGFLLCFLKTSKRCRERSLRTGVVGLLAGVLSRKGWWRRPKICLLCVNACCASMQYTCVCVNHSHMGPLTTCPPLLG